jgi:Na+-driven multidrug efflux pump
MWPWLQFEVMRRYLQAQSILWPIVVSSTTVSIANIAISYCFIYVLDWGITGAALGTALAYWINLLLIVTFTKVRSMMIASVKEGRDAGRFCCCLSLLGMDNSQANGTSSTSSPKLKFALTPADSSLQGPSSSLLADVPHLSDDSLNRSDNNVEASPSSFHSLRPAYEPQMLVSPPPPEMVAIPVLVASELPSSASNSSFAALVEEDQYVESIALRKKGVNSSKGQVKVEDKDDTWPSPFSVEVFRGWGDYLRLGGPGAISMFIEWGSYEVSATVAGQLGADRLAAHTIFMQTTAFWYAMPLGMASAIAVLIGHALGSGKADEARHLARTGGFLHLAYGVVNGGIFVWTLRDYWPHVFSSNPNVISLTAAAFPILWLYGTFDSTKAVGMAILRGCGRPTITVAGNFLSCIMVYLPVSVILTQVLDWGLIGLWLGMSTAWLLVSTAYLVIIMRTDWQLEVQISKERNRQAAALESKPTAESEQPKNEKQRTVDIAFGG